LPLHSIVYVSIPFPASRTIAQHRICSTKTFLCFRKLLTSEYFSKKKSAIEAIETMNTLETHEAANAREKKPAR
jgi:hypothetical protein